MPETETDVQVETQAETTTTKGSQPPAAELYDGEPFDSARAKSLIERLKAENKELKPKAKQADELAMAEQKRKEAELSEAQKLAKKLEEAEVLAPAA